MFALVAIGAALISGPHRHGAMVGAVSASATAFASLLLMQRSADAENPAQAAILVLVLMFLARILVVALATITVVRAGDNVFAFVVAFFVPYFVFAAIEGWYVHGLGRRARGTA